MRTNHRNEAGVVPIERARHARPFGQGFAEIDSSEIVQRLAAREARRPVPPPYVAAFVVGAGAIVGACSAFLLS